MKLTALVNAVTKIPFSVFDQVDGSPATGLVDGDFSRVVILDDTDVTSSVALSVSEIGGGRYVASFTPNARGLWLLSVTTPDGSVYECAVDVGLFNSLETLRKETSNRHEIDFAAQVEVAYDDDNVTPIQKWELYTDGGEPVTTQVGVQTRRGPPLLPRD